MITLCAVVFFDTGSQFWVESGFHVLTIIFSEKKEFANQIMCNILVYIN